MSILYLATSPETLADRLADNIDRQAREGDVFTPAHIVVPNQYLGKWLRLRLARRHGIAVNLRFGYLESKLWDMLRAVDPRDHEVVPELLDADTYRLLVLSVLLGEDDPKLAALRNYFRPPLAPPSQGGARGGDDPQSRRSWRRAWHLADKLGNLIRDYEYHRQDVFIQPWIQNKLVLGKTGGPTQRRSPFQEFEKGQYAVFDHIIRLKGGKRALLNEKTGKNYKTLPQYAMEVLEVIHNSKPRGEYSNPAGPPLGSPIHLFGLAQISALHINTLHWLGRFFDVRLYHLNPLTARLSVHGPASVQILTAVANGFRIREEAEHGGLTPRRSPGEELLRVWGNAGAESLWLMGKLAGDFQLDIITPARAFTQKSKSPEKVLHRLQRHLLGEAISDAKLPQDTSLQIVGCPGGRREVETVFHGILHNMQTNPTLRLTDIAVLVTDMNKYRPMIQAVFERPPLRIGYNLMDYSAAGLSTIGQGFLGLLDLALESFTRSRVLEVLLNPCFLARLGVERTQALTWARWAKELGIYQGWDAQEKMEQGYSASSLFGWRLGLQRLRLGRFMDTQPMPGQPAPRFGTILPFADLESQDREQLDAFSRAVDGLLPTLVKLRNKKETGAVWADALRHLLHNFLAIPEDRPEEAQVRDRLLATLDLLPFWDHLQPTPLPLSLIREFIRDHLEAIEGRHGEYLAGGVTIAPLAAIGPIPFSIIYVLGLGEDNFPGSNSLPSFDLRGQQRLPGDIRPAEKARYLFLETLLAAKDKIYLLWNNKDVQKDQNLLPAIPVVQLQRYVNQHILDKEFAVVNIPLHDRDPKSLTDQPKPAHDVGLFVNETERLLALAQSQEKGVLNFNKPQQAEIEKRLRPRTPDFTLPTNQANVSLVSNVTIKDLKEFLVNPAGAALKRHLFMKNEEQDNEPQDDEPFVSSFFTGHRLMVQVLQNLIQDTAKCSLAEALRAWPNYFKMLYEEEGLRCRAPESDFGIADQAHLHAELQNRISDSLEGFLQERDPGAFCGPVLLGASITPIGARRRFPALNLELPHPVPQRPVTQVKINGHLPLVWADANNLDILVLTSKAKLEKFKILSDYLFEPVLFYLALLANPESLPGEISSRSWLKGGKLNVHISTKENIESYTYVFSVEEAVAYLGELAADYLDPTAFDLLPFEVIAGEGKNDDDLSAAYVKPADQVNILTKDYYERLKDKIEEEVENTRNYWHTSLLELAKAQVPEDAFAKIRRRFHLLDRGPAQHRDK